MRTEKVNKLLAPLNPTVRAEFEPETTGFSIEEIETFSKLSDDELVSLACYRSAQNQRTILHRLALTNVSLADPRIIKPEVNAAFLKNLTTLFNVWGVALTDDDGPKLTRRVLDNQCVSFVMTLIKTAKNSKKLEYPTAASKTFVFEHPGYVTQYLNHPDRDSRIRACQIRSIATPTARSVLPGHDASSATATANRGAMDIGFYKERYDLDQLQIQWLKRNSELRQREEQLRIRTETEATKRQLDLVLEENKRLTQLVSTLKTEIAEKDSIAKSQDEVLAELRQQNRALKSENSDLTSKYSGLLTRHEQHSTAFKDASRYLEQALSAIKKDSTASLAQSEQSVAHPPMSTTPINTPSASNIRLFGNSGSRQKRDSDRTELPDTKFKKEG